MTNATGNLPNLIVIGAMKSGTTSLHDYLAQHPDVAMSTPKELDYFLEERNYTKGASWYRAHFQTDKKIRGESSVNYTKRHAFKGVPQRMAATFGEVHPKFIYLLRDPVERLVSHFVDSINYGHIRLDYDINSDWVINQKSPLVLTSKYWFQLEPYLAHFAPEQFLIVTTEALRQDRLGTMNEIFDFLNLSPIGPKVQFDQTANVSDKKMLRNRLGYYVMHSPLVQQIKRTVPTPLAKAITHSKLYRSLTRTPARRLAVELTAESRRKLRDIFADDMAQLRKFTGKPLSEWTPRP